MVKPNCLLQGTGAAAAVRAGSEDASTAATAGAAEGDCAEASSIATAPHIATISLVRATVSLLNASAATALGLGGGVVRSLFLSVFIHAYTAHGASVQPLVLVVMPIGAQIAFIVESKRPEMRSDSLGSYRQLVRQAH